MDNAEQNGGVVSEVVERVIEESRTVRKSREKYANGVCEAALSAAVDLSKIGSKKKEMRKRVARMIAWLRIALQEYLADKDMIMVTWAKRDENGEIMTEPVEGGKGTRVIMRNDAEAQLAGNILQREAARGEGEPPAPFTFDELEEYFTIVKGNKEVPGVSAELAARLGPFVILD